ncbi:hypothetical protein BX616_006435 [Lobosporangium transversale]|uniref:Uncharacterized protein n=1 Tax=Lobosporangium transversale TaxID=64571 RepID=A0A1Y2H3I6_9FUNG|nr:hypothetical protein BCR41DRAFT_343755 [Lobosporangium transversale]KAF9915317.1 hypothetical protein BX616_006435 [Lobosporangium transversale]ORZ28594.1 hypothetical protein BCR41DRAFT_343755 [Lobosporangium transversale]|eukprot:XP_021886267.1 hypothetical protein BCR41DRAFT_343755 [Lobosporangium transversale]
MDNLNHDALPEERMEESVSAIPTTTREFQQPWSSHNYSSLQDISSSQTHERYPGGVQTRQGRPNVEELEAQTEAEREVYDGQDGWNYEAPFSQQTFFQHAQREQQVYVREVLQGRPALLESRAFPQEYYTPEEMCHIYGIGDEDDFVDSEESTWTEYGHSGPINPFSDPRIYEQLRWTNESGDQGMTASASASATEKSNMSKENDGTTTATSARHSYGMAPDPPDVRNKRDFITAIELGMRIQRQQQLRAMLRSRDAHVFRDQDSAIERENKQRAANALFDHSTLLLHALSMNETPAKARMRMFRHLTGMPQPQHSYTPSKQKCKEKENENASSSTSRTPGSSRGTLPQEATAHRPRRDNVPLDDEFAHTYFQGPRSY